MIIFESLIQFRKHIPVALVDIAALVFLVVNEEFRLFEILLVSQLVLLVLLLAVHRQTTASAPKISPIRPQILVAQIFLLAIFCAVLFLLDLPWSLNHDWQRPAHLIVGKYSDVTTILGISIGAITVVGCLMLRKRSL